jgi:hypothetical protein
MQKDVQARTAPPGGAPKSKQQNTAILTSRIMFSLSIAARDRFAGIT